MKVFVAGATGALGRQLVPAPRKPHGELLQPPRHVHGPRPVPEVPPDLADDRRHRVRRQLHALLELEAVDRLDEPDRSHLHQVLGRLAAARVAVREGADERHQLLHEPVAGADVSFLEVRDEKRALVAGRHVTVLHRARM